ncbi:YadA C-terminal domain-containing protein [Leclercia adecarboxylata]|uniref:YadA C-terminal domain-containing protein n=1 Tax=Leclercia adecarboxylata TaxID=83655 RepID=UPI00244B8272|nr:YadA C-terminal domain-containing protein [Leclercia adecarboxylata]MDH0062945.1 YadA-like family protein [Leclercia adecarboxylata]
MKRSTLSLVIAGAVALSANVSLVETAHADNKNVISFFDKASHAAENSNALTEAHNAYDNLNARDRLVAKAIFSDAGISTSVMRDIVNGAHKANVPAGWRESKTAAIYKDNALNTAVRQNLAQAQNEYVHTEDKHSEVAQRLRDTISALRTQLPAPVAPVESPKTQALRENLAQAQKAYAQSSDKKGTVGLALRDTMSQLYQQLKASLSEDLASPVVQANISAGYDAAKAKPATYDAPRGAEDAEKVVAPDAIPAVQQKTPVAQKTPVLQPQPLAQKTPVLPPQPVAQKTPVLQPQPVAQKTPVLPPQPVAQKIPVLPPVPAVQKTPVLPPQPVTQMTPPTPTYAGMTKPTVNPQPTQFTPMIMAKPDLETPITITTGETDAPKAIPTANESVTVKNDPVTIDTYQAQIDNEAEAIENNAAGIAANAQETARVNGEVVKQARSLAAVDQQVTAEIENNAAGIAANAQETARVNGEVVKQARSLAAVDQQIAAENEARRKTDATVAAHSAELADHESRIQTLESETNSKFGALKNKIEENRQRASAGIAGVAAMANIPQVTNTQNFSVGAGVGNTDGESALAVGFSARATENVVVKSSVSNDTQHNFVVGAGVSYGW